MTIQALTRQYNALATASKRYGPTNFAAQLAATKAEIEELTTTVRWEPGMVAKLTDWSENPCWIELRREKAILASIMYSE